MKMVGLFCAKKLIKKLIFDKQLKSLRPFNEPISHQKNIGNMVRHKILAKLIGLSVPFLNLFRRPPEWPYSFHELSKMDSRTLGNELYKFLTSRQLEYLPKYEMHDAYHALLGYGTTVTEELKEVRIALCIN